MRNLKQLTDNQLRLIRASLLYYKDGMRNLRSEFKFDEIKRGEMDIVIGMCSKTVKGYEDELRKRHVDFSFKAGDII